MFKRLAVAAALVVGAAGASATAYSDFGTLDIAPSYDFASKSVSTGLFTDFFSFTAPVSNGVGSAAHSLKVTWGSFTFLDISGLSLQLLDTDQSTVLATGALGSSGIELNYTTSLTAGSTYFFKVAGTATGLSGGSYALTAAAAPVPEPTAAAMMLAGLGVMGFVATRRRRRG